jgi:hypothetical protein
VRFRTNFVLKTKETNILCSITFFRNRAVYDISCKNYGRGIQVTDDNIIQRIRFACWINKATDTHSEYGIVIDFPRQQLLRQRASMLRLYVHFLSCIYLT